MEQNKKGLKRENLEVGSIYICILSGFKYLILNKQLDKGRFPGTNEPFETLRIEAKYFDTGRGSYVFVDLESDISDYQLV